MGKLIGYCNMRNKDGKVLIIETDIKKNGVGKTTYTKNVYGDDALSITPDCIGKEIAVNMNVNFQ